MGKAILSEANLNLWFLIGKANHTILLVRKKELSQYNIPVRQLYVLRAIQTLGSRATLIEIARTLDREYHVISSQAIAMEKDGLIQRTKSTPKSNLLKLELTKKGADVVRASGRSKSIDTIFSFLNETDRKHLEFTLGRIIDSASKYKPDGQHF